MRKGGSYIAGETASEEEPVDNAPPDPNPQNPSPPSSGTTTQPPKGGFFSPGDQPAHDEQE